METITKIMKKRFLRKGIIYFLTWCLVLNTSLPAVLAGPVGGIVDTNPLNGGGNADITYNTGTYDHTTLVEVKTDRTIINWESLDTKGGAVNVRETLAFTQGALKDSAVLNRVISGFGTQFLGDLNAQGMRIFIVNPAGIVFGEGSTVNVTQLVASNLNITNDNFLSGGHEFAGDIEGVKVYERLGIINNSDKIYAAEGVAFIGRKILNAGTISTGKGGFVVMAAGDEVLLGQPGSNVLVKMDSVAMPGEGDGKVINDGLIESESGTVVLAAGDMFTTALELELALEPAKVSGGFGRVEQNGTIDTDGIGGDGGQVMLTAADEVILSAGSLTKANAGTTGDSGLVVVYSKGDTTVQADAKIEAMGGHVPYDITDEFDDVVDTSVEISGNKVSFAGDVDASASYGKRGKVIIDAMDMTIADGYMPDAPPDNTVYEKWIEAQSYASTDVELVAHSKTEGNIIAEPISDGVIEGGSGDIVLRTKYDTGGITFMPGTGGDRTAIHTTEGGNVYMLAGGDNPETTDVVEGGIAIGDIISLVPQHAPEEWIVEPGKIRLLTTNYGDITTGQLSVDGGSYDEISVIASGDLLINGDVTTYAHQVDEDLEVGKARTCLVSEHGDVEINGIVTVEAHAKYKTTADIHIDAGRDVSIDLGGGQILATALTSAEGSANASVLIHAGKETGPSEKGNITITNPKSADKAIYLRAQTQGSKKEIYSDGKASEKVEINITDGHASAKLELDEKHADDCPDCPTPPGLIPPLPPITVDDKTAAHMNDPVKGNVFDNDTLPQGDEITAHVIEDPEHGELDFDSYTGEYTYEPEEGFVGTDTFTYVATDGELLSETATVTITMTNELPVANPSSASEHMGIDKIENEPLSYSDVPDELDIIDKDLAVNIVTDPLYGDVTLQWDETSETWTYTYVPKDEGEGYFVGTDSFEYTVTDPQGIVGEFGTAKVTINITNDLPVPEDDNFITDPGVLVGGNVLDNDFDQNKDPLSVVLNGTSPQHGQLVLNKDGTFTYVPDKGFSGKDSFTYLVTDGQIISEPAGATVTITVNPGEEPPPPAPAPAPAPALPYIAPAPGLERIEFEVSGCPALVAWAAAELGIDERVMQVWAVNALASSQDIHPCDACERLKGVAAILRDDGGTRVAALAQVIGEFAPSTAPPTDEQMASVADVIQRNSQAYNHYATAGEYIDALVVYVGILNNDLNFSAEESVMFAVDNYVVPLADNQSTGLAAFVAARLAGLGGS